MGTKHNPGKYDCYAKAEPDEPLFTLLARDEMASDFVSLWASLNSNDPIGAVNSFFKLWEKAKITTDINREKMLEAFKCSVEMQQWRQSR